MLFIGGGFSALLTSARLREVGVETIRIVERGGDVGGTWYWNRYPGVACDVISYDYLPLLDEMGYVPTRHYARGPEILAHCQAIARRYDLYELAVFQTTVTSTVWNDDEQLWHLDDRPRRPHAGALRDLRERHAVEAEAGEDRRHGDVHRALVPHLAVGLRVHRRGPRTLHDKVVGIIGTGATAVQAIPNLGANAKELYVFQRTPSSIDITTTGRPIRSGPRS